MSRLFDDASSEDLRNDGIPAVTVEPLTMVAWFNSTTQTLNQTIMSIVDKDTTDDWWELDIAGAEIGDRVRAFARAGGTNAIAQTTTGYSSNTWHHAIAVFTSDTSRDVYIDNGSVGNSTVSKGPANFDRTIIGQIGHSSQGNYFSGLIAEAAVWNIALNTSERQMLADGFSPLWVRPDSLVNYWPLIGRYSPEIDVVGGINLTLTNTPSVGEHTRIIYPSIPRIMPSPAAVAVAGNIFPILLRRRRR